MQKNICSAALAFLFVLSGLFAPNLTFVPGWLDVAVKPAHAHGDGGGGENPGIQQFRPSKSKARDRNKDDRHELPLPREVRELGGLIVRGAAALREANGNIDFLTALEREVERMGGIDNRQRDQALRDIRNAAKEQRSSRDEIRAHMREAFSVIGVYLGKRGARESLRELARAREQARRAEKINAIVKLGKDGLTMIDNARAANAALNAAQDMMNSALSFFNR